MKIRSHTAEKHRSIFKQIFEENYFVGNLVAASIKIVNNTAKTIVTDSNLSANEILKFKRINYQKTIAS